MYVRPEELVQRGDTYTMTQTLGGAVATGSCRHAYAYTTRSFSVTLRKSLERVTFFVPSDSLELRAPEITREIWPSPLG